MVLFGKTELQVPHFILNLVFNVAALCTTSVLWFILPPQMKQVKGYNKTKSCNTFWNAKMFRFLNMWWIYSHNKTTPRNVQL